MSRPAEDYRAQLQALLPPGAAWPRDPDSVLARLLGGFAEEMARLDARGDRLVEEADPRTTFELLADWERFAGLPDPCVGEAQGVAARREVLVERLNARGGQSAAWFEALAASLGYEVRVREHRPFYIGHSGCGDALTNPVPEVRFFEIGHSGCGEPLQQLDYGWRFWWRVDAEQATIRPFRIGQSGCGEPLRAWGNDQLVCAILPRRPAHTRVMFTYGRWHRHYDFLAEPGALPIGALLERAGVGTWVDEEGVLRDAGANEPRWTWRGQGGTWAPAGLLVEPARTNAWSRSNELDNTGAWTRANLADVVADSGLGPDGEVTLDKLVPDATLGVHGLNRNHAFTAGQAVAVSWVVAPDPEGYADGSIGVTAPAFGTGQNVFFDLGAGAISEPGGQVIATRLRPLANGCWRVEIVLMPTASAVSIMLFRIREGVVGSFSGDGVKGLFAGHAQLEDPASAPSSHIRTVASAVTRAADTLALEAHDGFYDVTLERSAADGSVETEVLEAEQVAGGLWQVPPAPAPLRGVIFDRLGD